MDRINKHYEPFVALDPETGNRSRHLLVYFLTGNPGLIGYYNTYLNALGNHFNKAVNKSDTAIHVYGCSLAGFETRDRPTNAQFEAKYGTGPYNVDQQIDYIDQAIDDAYADLSDHLQHASSRLGRLGGKDENKIKAVLIGHSFGTYMSLEILQRRRRRQSPVSIIGVILLCPTVMNLAQSPSGRKITRIAPVLNPLTIFLAFLAKLLTSILSASLLVRLIEKVAGHPPNAALTTYSFLESRNGVRQALYLARHEMVEISTDKWSDEIWGAVASPGIKTKLFFYFAENDHWVANETRDQIIAARAYSGKTGEEDKPP
ncbi:Lipid-droplet associated hydrolase-like protein [Elsinoe fawcettii]|nr:Lipid-droplet associated hydrolase-like protein [Elsinoe fawcettii]